MHNASVMIDRNLAAGRSDRVALLAGERRLTYADVAREVARVGWFLREAGVRREQRVLLVLDDTPAFHASFLGAIRVGAVPIPVNPLDRVDNFAYYLQDSYATAVVVESALLAKVEEALAAAAPLAPLVVVANGPAGDHLALEDAVAGQPGELDPVDTHRDDMAFWLYSSGSTGRPKGVVHLQDHLDVTAETYARHVLRLAEDDVCLSTTKLYHAYGLGNGMTFPFAVGAAAVPMAGPPKPERIFAAVAAHRPSLLFSVPALYAAMLKAAPEAAPDLSSVRTCVSAAEALPPAIQARWAERFGLAILDGIGSTEMLHIYCSNTPEDVAPGTSGRPVPGYELRLVDEHGIDVAPGEAGDLLVRGDSCAPFYWHQREKTRRCMRGEWFSSGDRYVRTPEGRYVYQGRADDMIKAGGLWVSPADVEACLVEHPAVSEAAVIGAAVDDVSCIKAFVICLEEPLDRDALADELRAWCKEHLRRYEFPRLVEFVEDFPRTATGKIQRYRLREIEATKPATA